MRTSSTLRLAQLLASVVVLAAVTGVTAPATGVAASTSRQAIIPSVLPSGATQVAPGVYRLPPRSVAGPYCFPGFVCLWEDANGQGSGYSLQAGLFQPDFRTVACGTCRDFNFNDEMTSWSNATGITYCWFFDINYSGESHGMASRGVNYIQNVTARENDQASSTGPQPPDGVC